MNLNIYRITRTTITTKNKKLLSLSTLHIKFNEHAQILNKNVFTNF